VQGDQANTAAERILTLLDRKPDSLRTTALAAALEPIAPRLSKDIASRAAARLRSVFEKEKSAELLGTLARFELSSWLAGSDRNQRLQYFLKEARDMPAPPCGAFAPLFGRDDLKDLVDMTRWPTCPGAERAQLVKRAGELTGRVFGTEGDGKVFRPDLRAFAAWARELGIDLSIPVRGRS
jgi:hypothetical protein